MTKFDERLIVSLPAELLQAIDQAAAAKLMKRPEWIRRAAVDRLEADGVAIVGRKTA